MTCYSIQPRDKEMIKKQHHKHDKEIPKERYIPPKNDSKLLMI